MTKDEQIRAIQGILGVDQDGDWKAKSQAALDALLKPDFLGDGTWSWKAIICGADVCVTDCRMTCFGGADDPQDSGETASGISTKENHDLAACSLPMDGRAFPKLSRAEHAALDGSPIPRVPWNTSVEVTAMGQTFTFPVIDLGPGKRTGNALDLTIAAARLFVPNATATNFAIRGSYRIIGAAKYAT